MKIFDSVLLNTEIEELKARGIYKGCYGSVAQIQGDKYLIWFLNMYNCGDYAFAWVEERYLDFWHEGEPEFYEDYKRFFATHKPEDKPAFEVITLKEYDLVELTVEKEEYAKHGVHKGMTGVILLDTPYNSEWSVTFTADDGEDIAELNIPEKYLKKVK